MVNIYCARIPHTKLKFNFTDFFPLFFFHCIFCVPHLFRCILRLWLIDKPNLVCKTMIIIRFRPNSRLGQLTYFDPTLGHNGPGMQARYKSQALDSVPLNSHECWDLGHTNATRLYSGIFQVHAFFDH